MDQLRVQVVTDDAALVALRPAWTRLHEAARGTVFQSCEWQLSWWAVYGHAFRLCVVAVWTGDRLAALLPLFRQTLTLMLVRVTRLRFLGEHETYGEYQPLVLPGSEEAAAAAAVPCLAAQLAQGSCDCLDFNSLPAECPFVMSILERLRAQGFRIHRDPRPYARMMMSLPRDVDAYFQSLSRHGRNNIKRDERQLLKNGVRHEVIADGAGIAVLDDFIALHEREWERRLGGGFFSVRRQFAAFLRLATRKLLERSSTRLHRLMDGDRMIAASQFFVMNGRCVGYVSGCDLTHPLARFSPGKVLSSLCIRDAIEAGGVEFDFLGGAEPYKRELGARMTAFSRAFVYRPGMRGLPARLFLLLLAALSAYREARLHLEMHLRKRGRD